MANPNYQSEQLKIYEVDLSGLQKASLVIPGSARTMILQAMWRWASASATRAILNFGTGGVIDTSSHYDYQLISAVGGSNPVNPGGVGGLFIPIGFPTTGAAVTLNYAAMRMEILQPLIPVYKMFMGWAFDTSSSFAAAAQSSWIRGGWQNTGILDSIQIQSEDGATLFAAGSKIRVEVLR